MLDDNLKLRIYPAAVPGEFQPRFGCETSRWRIMTSVWILLVLLNGQVIQYTQSPFSSKQTCESVGKFFFADPKYNIKPFACEPGERATGVG
jgi:hypothetical protein